MGNPSVTRQGFNDGSSSTADGCYENSKGKGKKEKLTGGRGNIGKSQKEHEREKED